MFGGDSPSVRPGAPARYIFGSFTLDVRERRLERDGQAVELPPKVFDALALLLARAGRLVRKDEFNTLLWPGMVVSETNLNKCIWQVRKALDDGEGADRYVETVPKQGYRFVAPVKFERATAPAVKLLGRPRWLPGVTAFLAVTVLLTLITITGRNWRAPPDQGEIQALAVLPFKPLLPDAADPLLELGLADTLITRLSASEDLRVRSFGSVRHYAGTTLDAVDAGRELGADLVLEGTAQRDGGRARITARLLSVPSGTALWSGSYDEPYDQAFLLQDRVSEAVLGALALQLRPGTLAYRSPCDGGDVEAYRRYRAARDLMHAPSPPRLRRAIAAYREVLDRDPTCARAWAGQAFAWRGLVITGDVDPRQAFPLSAAAVQQALALDPELAEAHAQLGFNQFWYDWDWAAAEASMRRAIDLNPSLPEAHMAYGHLLGNMLRFDDALLHYAQARALDPLSPIINTLEAGFLDLAGRREEARVRIGRTLEMAPGFWVAWLFDGEIALRGGDFEAAVAASEHAKALCDCTQADALLGLAYVQAGRRMDAEALLAALTARAEGSYVPPSSLAVIEAALGRHERALELLEQAFEVRDIRMSFIHLDADLRFRSLRDEPRYIALAARVGPY